MPKLSGLQTYDFKYKINQKDLKKFAENLFRSKFKETERLISVFDNSLINTRNLCVPISFFENNKSFKEKNDLFNKISTEVLCKIILKSLKDSGIDKSKITDFVFITSTGISTPTIDSFIINKLKLNEKINRYPLWGLGCAGGVSGINKAFKIASSDKNSIVLFCAIELCSLTFIRNDFSKSNLVATSLFSDGAVCCIVTGDNVKLKNSKYEIKLINSQSKLYYNTKDVMGWDISESGLKVIFSRDIPSLVNKKIAPDIKKFLNENKLSVNDIKNYIMHPGGIKVINAYLKSLNLTEKDLNNTVNIIKNYGNMSSVTVLYVLNEFLKKGFKNGIGLMASLGPGFSLDLNLLKMKNL
ncbi:MAG TPA: 3-oxoacyl-[acyl-carrier-protein] synthase III C-terminal domain-containing protein [Ignavibacteria bacterium]|nr:3-oxoacyl-[acyl-carrier-protein] synthase III C-terminal domain-containing protein [Ignavibacteria bacterium]